MGIISPEGSPPLAAETDIRFLFFLDTVIDVGEVERVETFCQLLKVYIRV
jgi:hypothetical protein